MTTLSLTFAAPAPVVLRAAPTLSLAFPDPHPVVLQVQGIQGGGGGGGGGATNLAWNAATRTLSSDTGTDAVLTLADGTNAGLMSSASFLALSTALQPGALIPWADIDGRPSLFPPSAHGHVAADISDFASAARGTVLTGYAAAGSRIALAATDTILGAFGKLGKWVADLAAVAFSGSASDLTTGTLPAARFDDTAHGNRAGGTLHPAATTSVAGFMSGADKTKLDGIATGATANATDAALRDRATHTGTAPASTISDFNSASRAQTEAALIAGTNVTITPAGSGATRTLTIAATGGGGATDLGYTPSTRLLTSSTGADVTLPLVGTDAGLMSATDKTKLDGVATGATANSADAFLLDRANHTGTQLAGTISNFGATVRAIALTGYAAAGSRVALAATDTILDAFGKLGKWVADLAAVAFSGSATDLTTGTLPAARMPAQTGDVTAPAGSTVQTLATVNANTGSWGLAGSVAQFTVNAKGLITAAANVAISVAATAISDSTAAGRAMLTAATAAAQTALLNTFTTTLKGLVPPPGTATGLFLRDDGTWAASGGGSPITVQDEGSNITTALGTLNFVGAGVSVTGGATATVTIPGGGGGSPGGSSGEIQWNNAGAFAGAADVEIEGGQLRLPAIAIPTAPAAGGLKLFGRDVGGRILPSSIGPSGLDSPLQPHLALNKVAWALPLGNSTTVNTMGISIAFTGTATAKNWASTKLYTYMRGVDALVTVAATTAVAAFRGGSQHFTVGGPSAALGGFHYICRWAPATGVAGIATHRAFAGLIAAVSAPTDIENSTRTNVVGMGWDAADANIQIMHNDASGTCTKIDLGASFPVPTTDRDNVYELVLFSPPGTTQSVVYRVRNLVTNAEATGTIATNLPPTTTALNPYGICSVGGTSSVVGITLFSLYIETDY